MAVKFVDKPSGRIRGLAIPFGGPVNGKDLDNQAFSAKTDFAFDWFPHGRPLLYRHGLDGAVKMAAVGRQLTHEVDPEVGVWAEAQLDMSHRYADAISALVEKRALGFTSGSVKHLTQVDAAGNIVRWPWIEESLSPMPANPWATVDPIKTLQTLELLGFEVPAGLAEEGPPESKEMSYTDEGDIAARSLADIAAFITRSQSLADLRAKEGRVMSTANRDRLSAFLDQLSTVAKSIDELLAETDPAQKGLLMSEFLRYQKTLAELPRAS
jgi:hypothetical protein